MPNNVSMDFVGNGQYQGEVAKLINNSRLDPARMRPFVGEDGGAYISVFKGGDPKKPDNYQIINVNAATLRREEWMSLDSAVIGIAEQRLTGFNYIKGKGLVYNLGNGMGTTVLESHTISDAMEADMTMDAVSRGKNDRPVFGATYLPIPIIHVDYEINERLLSVARSNGNPIDTTSAERAARRVAEKLEDMLFTNTTYTFGGGTIYSFVNHPSRIPVAFSDSDMPGAHWNDSGTTGANIVSQVLTMKQHLIENYFYGPYVIFIPTNYETPIDADYDATSGKTIRERILQITGIQDIVTVDRLSADNVLMVQLSSDVVRIVNGMPLQNVQWGTEGNLVHKYKVMTIQVPQIRADYNGRTGIVHVA